MKPTILLIGAGAVGSALTAWLAPTQPNLYVYDRPENAAKLVTGGIKAYLQHHQDQATTVKVNAISDLNHCPCPDMILLCVKNYSLADVSGALLTHYGASQLTDTIVVGLQNGVENQRILPQYFKQVVYGIVTFNAWLDNVGVVGYQAKGPFIIGTPDNGQQRLITTVVDMLDPHANAVAAQHFQDAALCKMVINLTNSLTTLTGLGYRDMDNMARFQQILSRLIYEGVNIVKAAGFKECKIGNAPPWWLIQASALLPQWLTRSAFKRNVKKMVLSSMAQDVINNGSQQTELDDINGHLLMLAQQHQVSAPYNQAIFKLCQQRFAVGQFKPMSVNDIWQAIDS